MHGWSVGFRIYGGCGECGLSVGHVSFYSVGRHDLLVLVSGFADKVTL